ncbi:hypothetical protein SASPL_114885 [Salvia splendens]|uniref:Uncharacterized protein n=1 Tax=Salvia splendens TaxID=180675 RepID=A0A8X9A0S6_SALSN|nr:hypothetical protein SASPL_114885 [Salvia splendens]
MAASSASYFRRLLPAISARAFSSRQTASSLNDPNPNWSNRPPKETILLDGYLPKVRWVLPDSYLDVKNKDYGGEPFINGLAVPYDPKYHEEWSSPGPNNGVSPYQPRPGLNPIDFPAGGPGPNLGGFSGNANAGGGSQNYLTQSNSAPNPGSGLGQYQNPYGQNAGNSS